MILTVVLASLAVYSWKLLGYLVPERFITPSLRSFSERVTVALLAALVAIQGFSSDGDIVFDARIAAVAVAGVLLAIRAPYILVVIAGAAVAAALRMLGL